MAEDKFLYYPKADLSQESAIRLDMGRIFLAESRIGEMSIVNAMKAPELEACILQGYLDASDFYSKVELELYTIQTLLDRRKSILLIDKMADLLNEKKLVKSNPSGNSDLRKAIVDLDPEYGILTEKQNHLEALHTYLKGKMMAFGMAHSAIERLIERRSFTPPVNPYNGPYKG